MTDKLSGYSTTPASNNAASPDGWPEGMTAGSVNNSDREFAARVREFYEDSQWIDYGHTIVSSTGSSIKLSGDVTATYTAGRAIRVNQSASQDGWVTASAYSAPDTSITVTGFTVAAPTQVEVGAVKDHTALPNNLSITVASLTVPALTATSAVITSLTVTNPISGLGIGTVLSSATYTTGSGTYSLTAGYDSTDTVFLNIIAGGGSGAVARHEYSASSGGEGGNCLQVAIRYADFPASASYSVGAGGAAVSSGGIDTKTDGNSGGNSSVTINGVVYLATGGAGGTGERGNTGTVTGATAENSSVSLSGATITVASPYAGGIGGDAYRSTTGGSSSAGGNSVKGGGGGGGAEFRNGVGSSAGAGGSSFYAGAGGAGVVSGTATSGSAPGGGGGGAVCYGAAGTSGGGASGRITISILRGWHPAPFSGL